MARAKQARQGSRAFVDGGTVKKVVPAAPLPDRPALGPNPVINQNESTYYGTKSGLDLAKAHRPGQPTSPMPGPGGADEIHSPMPASPQETEIS